MCIRDRFPTHRLVRDLPNFDKEAVLEKCSEFFYIDEKEGTDTMEAVSYTHLDVYKRQWLYRGSGGL